VQLISFGLPHIIEYVIGWGDRRWAMGDRLQNCLGAGMGGLEIGNIDPDSGC